MTLMATTSTLTSDPCPACGIGVPQAADRFCASCGARLERPDLRALAQNAQQRPVAPRPRQRVARATAQPAALAVQQFLPAAPPPMAVAPTTPAETSPALIVTLAVLVVVALAGIGAAIMLATTGSEQGSPTLGGTAPTAPTVTVIERR